MTQAPQLYVVGCTVMPGVAGVAGEAGMVGLPGVAGVAGVAGFVWHVVQTVELVTPNSVCEVGAVPVTHCLQLGIANALLANNVGNANADTNTAVLMIFFMVPPKSE